MSAFRKYIVCPVMCCEWGLYLHHFTKCAYLSLFFSKEQDHNVLVFYYMASPSDWQSSRFAHVSRSLKQKTTFIFHLNKTTPVAA